MRKPKLLKSILALLLLFIFMKSHAQTQNPYFTVPPFSAHMQQNPIPIPSFIPNYSTFSSLNGLFYYSYSGISGGSNYKSHYAHNMIADAGGHALAYIMDGNILDSAGFVYDWLNWAKYDTAVYDGTDHMWEPRSWGVFEDISGFSEVCVVPNPQNCKQFFIFASGALVNPGSGGVCVTPHPDFGAPYGSGGIYRFFNNYFYPFYGMIDFTKTNINGTPGKMKMWATQNAACGTTAFHTDSFNVAPLFPLLYPASFSLKQFASHYAATDVIGSGSSAYNLIFYSDGYKCFALKLDGTTPLTVLSKDSLTTADQTAQFRSEMEVVKLSSGNYRVAWPYIKASNRSACIHVQDYTSAGAKVAGTAGDIVLTPTGSNPIPYIHGLEFIADGSKLYFTHETTADYSGYIYSVTIGTWTTLNTVGTPPSVTDLQYSQIELNYKSSTPYLYLADSTNIVSIDPSSNSWNTTAATFPTSPARYYKGDLNAEGHGFVSGSGPVFPTYLLPDQIDGGYYPGSSGFNTSCCSFYNSYSANSYTVSGSNHTQVWSPGSNPFGNTSGTVYIESLLKIPMGYTVTIRNMTIKFTPQASLVVDCSNGVTNSAQLFLRGTTLDVDTRCGNNMWPGVRVWGNTSALRNNSLQGYLNIDTSSVITNAWIGIELGYNSSIDPTYTSIAPVAPYGNNSGGGQIIVQNSSFINNQRDIYFLDYTGTGGLSSIFKNTFTTNAYLLASSTAPLYHIQLNNYKPSANIQGNVFSCSTSLTTSGYVYACEGIHSVNSNVSVDQTTGNIKNKFSYFNYGVYASNTGGNTNTVSIKNSVFTDNVIGAYYGNLINPVFQSDSVKVRQVNGLCFGNGCGSYYSGLFLDNSTGYKVQFNQFLQNISGTRYPHGVVVSNSGAHVNCIFKNTFKNLYKGTQAQYRNFVSGGTPLAQNYLGLIYLCNTFTGTIGNADIYVPATASSSNLGTAYTDTSAIMFNQGSQSASYPQVGGNIFSKTPGGSDFHIETTGKVIGVNYIYYCTTPPCTGASNRPDNNNTAYVTLSAYSVSDVNCSTDPYSNGLRVSNMVEFMLSKAREYKVKCDSISNSIGLTQNSNEKAELGVAFGNARSTRHRLIDEAIHILMEDTLQRDSAEIVIHSLMKEKAMELDAHSQLETAIAIHDSAMGSNALNVVASREGQSNYVKLHTILLQNMSKTPEQILSNPSSLSQIQAIENDSTDRSAYVKANLLLKAIGLSDYQPYYAESAPQGDSSMMRKGHGVSQLISSSNLVSKPNPFKTSITINATVAEKTSNAQIVITDMLGKEVKQYQLQQGENEVVFSATDADQQIFFCSLVIDGTKIKTNKIVLIK